MYKSAKFGLVSYCHYISLTLLNSDPVEKISWIILEFRETCTIKEWNKNSSAHPIFWAGEWLNWLGRWSAIQQAGAG